MPAAKNKQELILPHFPSYREVSSYINIIIIFAVLF